MSEVAIQNLESMHAQASEQLAHYKTLRWQYRWFLRFYLMIVPVLNAAITFLTLIELPSLGEIKAKTIAGIISVGLMALTGWHGNFAWTRRRLLFAEVTDELERALRSFERTIASIKSIEDEVAQRHAAETALRNFEERYENLCVEESRQFRRTHNTASSAQNEKVSVESGQNT